MICHKFSADSLEIKAITEYFLDIGRQLRPVIKQRATIIVLSEIEFLMETSWRWKQVHQF